MSGSTEITHGAQAFKNTAGVVLQIDEALYFGIRLHGIGCLDEAEKLYRKIIEVSPDNPNALHLLGSVCHQQDRNDEASEILRHYLEIYPGDAEAYNTLGNTLALLQENDEAEDCYRRAISLNQNLASAYNNLGILLMRPGEDPSEALEACRKASELAPNDINCRFNLARTLREAGRTDESVEAFRNTLRLDPSHAGAWQELARISARHGCREEVSKIFVEFSDAIRDSDYIRFIETSCLGRQAPERAPDSYVEKIFDDMASDFDRHLQVVLDYKAPEMVAEALENFLPPASRALEILDIGCGTGLCGVLLRQHAKVLTGVDLSSGMLAKAAERNIYDNLFKCELTEFLGLDPNAYDVIACADTLCYFGSLENVFANALKAMKTGGFFAFTLELSENNDDSFILDPGGRYAHSSSYVERALREAGFTIKSAREVVLRKEGNKPVRGQLMVAEKTGKPA